MQSRTRSMESPFPSSAKAMALVRQLTLPQTDSADEAVLAQANAQGQTVILAAGDNGAADCDEGTAANPVTSAVNGLAVDYPGSSAYVTDAGGSEFMGDGTAAAPQTGAGTYWNSSGTGGCPTTWSLPPKSYIPEMAWNDTTFSIQHGGGLDAGGGGVSTLFNKPSWQTGVPGIPADGTTGCAGHLADASTAHDPYLYCTQVTTDGSPSTFVSSCQATSFRLSDPGQTDDDTFVAVAGGTSFAAPDLRDFWRSLSRSWRQRRWSGKHQSKPLYVGRRTRLPMHRRFTTSQPGTTRCPALLVRPIARRVPTR